MNKLSLISIVLGFVSFWGWDALAGAANTDSSAPRDAETILEMSVLDLVSKKPTKPTLPRRAVEPRLDPNYARQVASLLAKERTNFLSCLNEQSSSEDPGGKKNVSHSFQVGIRIDGAGSARVELINNGSTQDSPEEPLMMVYRDCVLKRLSVLSYPKHPLKNAVTVKLPIRLSEEGI